MNKQKKKDKFSSYQMGFFYAPDLTVLYKTNNKQMFFPDKMSPQDD